MSTNAIPNPDANLVLYVDDDASLCDFVIKSYSAEFNVVTAGSVNEALAILETRGQEVAVLMTDFHMPGLTGLDLLQIAQQKYRYQVRIIASAFADKHMAITAVNEGKVFRILEKPWSQDQGLHAIRDALVLYRAQATERAMRESRVQSMRETVGFLAHELNTPLVTVRGHMEALKARFRSEASEPEELEPVEGDGGVVVNGQSVSYPAIFDQRQPGQMMRSLQAVERCALWCQSLVSTFVQSAREAYPGATVHGTSAGSLIRALLNEFPFEGDELSWITAKFDYDFALSGQRDLFYLVLCTLTKNALIALTGRPNPSLTIELGHDPARRDRPAFEWIRFTDNGPGIAPELLSQLTHQPATTRAASGGNGMGLLFCKRVLQSVSGEIAITSPPEGQEGTGTRVCLYFKPAAEAGAV